MVVVVVAIPYKPEHLLELLKGPPYCSPTTTTTTTTTTDDGGQQPGAKRERKTPKRFIGELTKPKNYK